MQKQSFVIVIKYRHKKTIMEFYNTSMMILIENKKFKINTK